MKPRSLLLLTVIVIALGSIYFTTFRGMPKKDWSPYKALGKGIADETSRLVGNNGRVSIIINREFGALKIPFLETEMQALTEALKAKGTDVASIERVEMYKAGLAQPASFLAAIESQKDVDAIISLVGFPMAPGRDPAAFRNKAKLIVAAPYEPGLKSLLKDGIIQIAILPRFPSSGKKESQSPPRAFDDGFQVFTPKNAAELP
jgi:hypothetical protein